MLLRTQRRARGRRPLGRAEIDWSHPLARSLTRAYVSDGAMGLYDVARGQHGSLTGAPKAAGIAGTGSGLYCTGGASLDIPSSWPVSSTLYGWRLVFQVIAWTGSFTALIDGPARQLAIFVSGSGDITFAGGAGDRVKTSLGMTAGARWDLVSTNNADGSRTFLNGREVGSPTSGDLGLASVTETLSFGRNPSTGGTDADFVFESFQVWDREITASEAWAMYDPSTRWDLYRVPSTRVFFDVGGGVTPRRFFLV